MTGKANNAHRVMREGEGTMTNTPANGAGDSIKSLLSRADAPGVGPAAPPDPISALRELNLGLIAAAANDDQTRGKAARADKPLIAPLTSPAPHAGEAGTFPPAVTNSVAEDVEMPKCVSEARVLTSPNPAAAHADDITGQDDVGLIVREKNDGEAPSDKRRSGRVGLFATLAAAIVPIVFVAGMYGQDYLPAGWKQQVLAVVSASVSPADTVVARSDIADDQVGADERGAIADTSNVSDAATERIATLAPEKSAVDAVAAGLNNTSSDKVQFVKVRKEGNVTVLGVKAGDKVLLPIQLGPAHATADVGALVIRGLPADFAMTGASEAGDGSWVLAPQSLDTTRVHVPAHASGDIDLKVTMFNLAAVEVGMMDLRLEIEGGTLARAVSMDRAMDFLARGRTLLESGDVASARLLFERAAQAGIGEAAMLVGETYDPVRLAVRGVIGFGGDSELARNWYQRAVANGMDDAKRQLTALAAFEKGTTAQ